jgi:hypothetical protein
MCFQRVCRYVKLAATHYKRDIAAELETVLSIITSAYLRSEDIQTAVEESIKYINPPIRTVFSDFLSQVRLINPDVEAALKAMKAKIDNDVFHEWCDSLLDCQFDRSLKFTLTPIVSKLSDMRIVNGETNSERFWTAIISSYAQTQMHTNLPLSLNYHWR